MKFAYLLEIKYSTLKCFMAAIFDFFQDGGRKWAGTPALLLLLNPWKPIISGSTGLILIKFSPNGRKMRMDLTFVFCSFKGRPPSRGLESQMASLRSLWLASWLKPWLRTSDGLEWLMAASHGLQMQTEKLAVEIRLLAPCWIFKIHNFYWHVRYGG